MTQEIYYRFDDRSYSSGIDVILRTFYVKKHTPKGAWIASFLGTPRFVLNTANKQYACPTIDEAKKSFLARKARQIKIYKARVAAAEEAIALLERKTWPGI